MKCLLFHDLNVIVLSDLIERETTDHSRTQPTLNIRKIITNYVFGRKQLVIDILHHGRSNLSMPEIQDKLKMMHGVKDLQTIFVYGFSTHGAHSTGFGLIYDTVALAQKYESNHRLARNGIQTHIGKTKKECKHRAKKIRGMKKALKNKSI